MKASERLSGQAPEALAQAMMQQQGGRPQ